MVFEGMLTGAASDPWLVLGTAAVAFAAAVPAGPISFLAIHRAMSHGFWRAFRPTLGAVAAAVIFGVIAGLGAGYLTAVILEAGVWFKFLGAALVMMAGARLFIHQSRQRTDPPEAFTPWQLTALNFTLALSNPMTLAFYLAAFSFLGIHSDRLVGRQSLMIAGGTFLGALAWFVLICLAAGRFHMKVNDLFLQRVRRGTGGLLLLIGIFTSLSLLMAG